MKILHLVLALHLLDPASCFCVPSLPATQRRSTFRSPLHAPPPTRATTRLFLSDNDAKGRKKRLATGVAFLTGWADVALFKRYQTFATMMTGNLMWLAAAAIEQRFKMVAYYGSVIAAYIVGMAAFRRMDLSLRKRCLRVCSLAVVALFVGSDLVHWYAQSRWIPVVMLAAGYGIINSIGTEVAGTLTFVVTGHMTKLTHQCVDRISRKRGRQKLSQSQKVAALQNIAVTGGFFAGAMFASVLETKQRLSSGVFSVLGILYGALFYWLDMESIGGAWWLRKNGEMCELDDDGELCDLEEDDVISSREPNGLPDTGTECAPGFTRLA